MNALLYGKKALCGKKMVPNFSVKKEGFSKLLQTVDPRYELPSRKYFVELPCLYTTICERVAHKLKRTLCYATKTDF